MNAPTVSIRVIGHIWLPPVLCAMDYTAPLKTEEPTFAGDLYAPDGLTREAVEEWCSTNTGDFQSIEDFEAEVSLPTSCCSECDRMQYKTVRIDWQDEDSECLYYDCHGEGE